MKAGVYADSGSGQWATVAQDAQFKVRHVENAEWVEILGIPGLAVSACGGGGAWVPLGDVNHPNARVYEDPPVIRRER